MTLSIENQQIIGKIDDLEDKLEGKLPVDRLELIELINSWGRYNSFQTSALNYNQIEIKVCEPLECYNLSKLDVSRIKNMNCLFKYSMFNGDISQWNTSNVTSMVSMFKRTIKFNGDISNWDVSNVTSMNSMFYQTEKFNSDIGNWDVYKVTDMSYMFSFSEKFNQNISDWNLNDIVYFKYAFYKVESFLNKYNNGEILPNNSNELKKWFNENRDRMNDLDIKDKYSDQIDGFFSKINNINSLDIKYK